MDLKDLAPEVTHNLWRDVQNGDGRINLLVTISGTTRGDSPSNLLNYEQDIDKLQSQWMERYVSCMLAICLSTFTRRHNLLLIVVDAFAVFVLDLPGVMASSEESAEGAGFIDLLSD